MPLPPYLQSSFDVVKAHCEGIDAEQEERISSMLARLIVDETDPARSIAELEKIGEQKLRVILEWLGKE